MFVLAGPAEAKSVDRWLAGVHTDDRAMVLERMKESETTGSMNFEYRYHHPETGMRWLHVKGQMRGADSAANGPSKIKTTTEKADEQRKAYGVGMDGTGRKNAEAARSLSQPRLMIA